MRHNRLARIAIACLSATAAMPLLSSASAAEDDSLDARWTFDQWRPTIASSDERFSLSLRTRLQVDAGGFNQPGNVEEVTALHDVESL